ncbi:hypothetical protein [Streptosporangium sp. 'caverna']|uniref:hypothetical protein n=1 Tax=Streptosporangium sp. 'caverna' TaxID=2202249 RepID=UPI000D7D4183|nr:hypothetical protein [Streptosporangium sp. 'caverna']AWS43028.1 hypothetical protein DKM19_18295 [Streptosporangium sp. 'caverna']
MTFNIGNQQAVNINNVGGDQTVQGGQQGTFLAGEPGDWAESLVTRLQALGLRVEAAEAEAVQTELARSQPDRQGIATRLIRLTDALNSAGAIAQAGESLRGPLMALASWLGALGAPVMRMLTG